MGFNINGTKMLVESNTLKIKDYNDTSRLSYDNIGVTKRETLQPMFYACENVSGWTSAGAINTWNTMSWGNIITNNSSCFSSSAFTAPVTGAYVFTASQYWYWPSTSGILYSIFAVNGATGGRNYNASTHFRSRGYGVTSGYAFDSDMQEVYFLNAGDYVNTVVYFSYVANYYGAYGHFAGWLIG